MAHNMQNDAMSQMNVNVNANHQAKMSEKELLDDLLTQEKHLLSLYNTALTESSCTNMREMLLKNLQELNQDQFNLFDQMAKRGYYPIKAAQDQDVQQVKQRVSQMQGTLMH